MEIVREILGLPSVTQQAPVANFRERLVKARDKAAAHLERLDAALKALDANPGMLDVLELFLRS